MPNDPTGVHCRHPQIHPIPAGDPAARGLWRDELVTALTYDAIRAVDLGASLARLECLRAYWVTVVCDAHDLALDLILASDAA